MGCYQRFDAAIVAQRTVAAIVAVSDKVSVRQLSRCFDSGAWLMNNLYVMQVATNNAQRYDRANFLPSTAPIQPTLKAREGG